MSIERSSGYFKPESELGVHHKNEPSEPPSKGGIFSIFKSKKVTKSDTETWVDKTSSDLVKKVWESIDHQDLSPEEIQILDKLDEVLGGAGYTESQAKVYHEFLKDPKRRETIQKVVSKVEEIRKVNIERINMGESLLKSSDPKLTDLLMLSIDVMGEAANLKLPEGLSQNTFKFFEDSLEERAIIKNSQIVTDILMHAVDQNYVGGTGTAARHRGRVTENIKNRDIYSFEQRALIDQHFTTRTDDLNGVWQKSDWIVEKGKDLGGGRTNFEKGYLEVSFAIPGHDIRRARAELDLRPLGSLSYDQTVKVFEALQEFLTLADPTEVDKSTVSFLGNEELAALNTIAKKFREESETAAAAALISLGDPKTPIKGVYRDVEGFNKTAAQNSANEVLNEVFRALKIDSNSPDFSMYANLVAKSPYVLKNLEGLIDEAAQVRMTNLYARTKGSVDLKDPENESFMKSVREMQDQIVKELDLKDASSLSQLVLRIANYGLAGVDLK